MSLETLMLFIFLGNPHNSPPINLPAIFLGNMSSWIEFTNDFKQDDGNEKSEMPFPGGHVIAVWFLECVCFCVSHKWGSPCLQQVIWGKDSEQFTCYPCSIGFGRKSQFPWSFVLFWFALIVCLKQTGICFLVINVSLRAEDAEIQKKYFSGGLLPRESKRINPFVVGSTNQRGYIPFDKAVGQMCSAFDNKRQFSLIGVQRQSASLP